MHFINLTFRMLVYIHFQKHNCYFVFESYLRCISESPEPRQKINCSRNLRGFKRKLSKMNNGKALILK